MVPGFILLFLLFYISTPLDTLSLSKSTDFIKVIFLVVVSYPIGVGLNYLSRFVKLANQRSAIDVSRDPSYEHVKLAIEHFFRIAADRDSWKYCFGIVTKHGYSVNVDLFARLDIFCRSMMVSAAVVFVGSLFLAVLERFVPEPPALWWVLAGSAATFLIFLYSSRTYSRAFVGAIYEGFYSWYVDSKAPFSPPT